MKGSIHILVLGKEGVGKTAVVVRYLTKRYLPEYAHAAEMTYERLVPVDGKQVPVKFTDISGKNIEQKASNKDLLTKVDGVLVVYSVTDRHSFDVADGICNWLRRDRKSSTSPIPIVLLGNMADLEHRRCVTRQQTTADDLQWRNDCYLVSECSACSGADDVTTVINKLIQKIIERREIQTKQQRKLSQIPLGSPKMIRASIKRRFSVFTRERTSTM